MSGLVFQCLIFTDCGDLVSDPATLIIIQNAIINNQPESITVCEGINADFLVFRIRFKHSIPVAAR